jgi:DNA-binding transcriptional regulator YdaS (Cro superfamily)
MVQTRNPVYARTAKEKKERRLEMLKVAAPFSKKAFDFLGSYYSAAAFLTISYPQVQKIRDGRDFFNVKSAMMIEKISGGELTLKQLRPDLHFSDREINEAIEQGKLNTAAWAEAKNKPYRTGVLLDD